MKVDLLSLACSIVTVVCSALLFCTGDKLHAGAFTYGGMQLHCLQIVRNALLLGDGSNLKLHDSGYAMPEVECLPVVLSIRRLKQG